MRTEPITHPSAWHGDMLERDRSFEHHLQPRHLNEIETALRQVKTHGLSLAEITRERFVLPTLAGKLGAIARELTDGLGFALLRGLPVARYPIEDLEKVYWGLCAHLGTGITQNGQGDLIHYVTDGRLRPSQGSRGVGLPHRSRLHVDLTDCVSLLCVRQAPDDPPSQVASSMWIYNEVLRQRPRDLRLLYEGFYWDRKEEHRAGEHATTEYKVPLFSERDGLVSCRYNRAWIEPAARRRGEALTDAQVALLDFIDEVAAKACLSFSFQPGDIQFCNNYTVFHGRPAHAPIEDETKKRLLLRIWLDFDEARPMSDPAIVRYGIVRHGALGWPAPAVLHARQHGVHPR
ncbi:MAG: TauD/TfdA family dioxygenase, partial [Gammaproteobacteria bacterium]|nr:TauD/TfdA family dioxygenase [Gammaproteobacteria bacterium]